jgi:hypothetical protein
MANYFDEFSKMIGEGSMPRRESLRRLGLAVTATILAPLGVEFARASHMPSRSQDPCKAFCKCRHGRQQDQCIKACKACNKDPSRLAGTCGNYVCCGDDLVSCTDYCADTARDPYNCGVCGNVCPPPGANENVSCEEGNCEYYCVDGAVECEGTCTFLDWDPNNCSACGNVCSGPDPHCNSGVCSDCGAGKVVCDNSCVDLNWDANNCGSCSNVCGESTPYCSYGTCTECPPGYDTCNGTCTDILWDWSNCGACGYACGPYEYCYYGVCYYYWGGYGGGGYYGGW